MQDGDGGLSPDGAAIWRQYSDVVLPAEGTGAFAFASAAEIAELHLPRSVTQATLTKERMDLALADFQQRTKVHAHGRRRINATKP